MWSWVWTSDTILTYRWGSWQCWSDPEQVYNDLYHTTHSSDQRRKGEYPGRIEVGIERKRKLSHQDLTPHRNNTCKHTK